MYACSDLLMCGWLPQAKRLEELDRLYREEVVSRKRAHNALQVCKPASTKSHMVTQGTVQVAANLQAVLMPLMRHACSCWWPGSMPVMS